MPTRRFFRVWGTLSAAVIATQWTLGASAAESAPATPLAGSAVACSVSPRARDESAALLADPDIATPAAATGGQTLPAGSPVDAETSAEMVDVVRTWLACQNAGEPLRAWSLFSDGYLHRLLSRQGMPELEDVGADTDAAGARLLEIRGQRALPDGRFGATVTVSYPSVPNPKTFFFFFTEVEDRLVIDGILGEISFSVP